MWGWKNIGGKIKKIHKIVITKRGLNIQRAKRYLGL